MKTVSKHIVFTLVGLLPLGGLGGNTLSAQTITFDSDDYAAVSTYDSWEGSPFRNGTLTGKAQVVKNHLNAVNDIIGYAPDGTKNIVGFQRSRYASNLYGVRIDLKTPFRLTKTERYVHVMVNRPVSDSRLMLITLGKRSERAGQSKECEQTWSLSSTTVGQDGWYDAVFAIKGFSNDDTSKNGIDIYSLVICPDVTDRSTMKQDFACYIDQIEVNSKSAARFSIDNYPISFDKATATSRTDRVLNGVGVSGGADGTQSVSGLSALMYNDKTSQPISFLAKAGETIQPTFAYTGTWMSGYVYVDWGNDGTFNSELNANGTPATGSDVVSYSSYAKDGDNGTFLNSVGTNTGNGNQIQSGVPTFSIPASTVNGYYRMRYKVDWNSIDPAGNPASDNLITSNGGGITDVLLNVHGTQCNVTAAQLNGDIYDTNGVAIQDYKVTQGKDLTIKVVPAPGFTYSGIRVRYGYNLTGDSLIHDNPQYFDVYYKYSQFKNDELTLPASLFLCDNVEIEGYMKDEKLLDMTDKEVANPTLGSVTLFGTQTRTYEITDPSHTVQDVTAGKVTYIQEGKQLITSLTDGVLYIDFNRDGQYSMITEAFPETIEGLEHGTYRAVLASGDYRIVFLLTIHGEMMNIRANTTNGRIIGRQVYTSTESDAYSTSTGLAEKVVPFKFLGLYAQPICSGYTCSTATVRHGYNLDGDQVLNGVTQWTEYQTSIKSDCKMGIAKDSVCGDIIITANFEPTADCQYLLTFDDEFNEGTTPNASVWRTCDRENAAWNRYISNDSRVAYIQDGYLVCKAFANDNKTKDSADMLTGAKDTKGHFSFIKGYIEVRAKTTPHTGNFPAIWMMPENRTGGWPTCGEIDIWETVNEEAKAHQTVHSNWTYTLGNTSNPQSTNGVNYTMDGEWHTYGLLKEPTKLTWYVDGNEVFSYSKSDDEDVLSNGQWPYDKAFYIILNQSVGMGSWAANPDKDFTYETLFDWCRVYQTQEDINYTGICSPAAAPSNTNDAIYDLQGRRISRATHGIYISGGKKIIKK